MQQHELYKRSRSCAITCLWFGANRKDDFPEHFFCHGCDLLEDAVLNSTRRRRQCRESNKRFKCTGGHTDLAKPTSLKRMYRPSHPLPSIVKTPDTRRTNDQSVAEEKLMMTGMIDESIVLSGDDDSVLLATPATAICDPRRLFTNSTDAGKRILSTSAALGAASAISTESSTSHGHAEAEISLLQRRIVELDESNRNLQRAVLSLTKQIAVLSETHLQGQQAVVEQDEKMPTATNGNDNDVDEDQHVVEDGNLNKDAAISHRCRVSIKNAELSHKLSILIEEFTTRAELADRRKFPERRLAKIIVESVTSFKWTHLEVLRFANTRQKTRSPTSIGRQIIADDYSTTSSTAQLTSELLGVLNRKRQGRHRGDKSKATLLIQCLWDDGFLQGEAKACMIDKVRTYLRTHVFSPWKILKAMDLAGFKLSLAGIEVLRHVEVPSRYGRGSLPSKSTILRCARKLEAAAKELCPFTMIGRTFQDEETQHAREHSSTMTDDDDDSVVGEGFEFDTVKVTETLFRAYGLIDEAKQRSVELGLASDGAQLTNTVSHVAAGLKFNDVTMRDPTTKKPMLLHSPDSLVQSRNLCFPLRIVIAKDSKKTLEGFRSLYNSFNAGDVAEALDCRPFKMSFPGDMKLQWGALDEGGAAKVKEKFCYICPCRSSSIHIPQDKTKCQLCMNKRVAAAPEGGTDMEAPQTEYDECYHYPFFADPAVRATMNEELDVLTSIITADEGGAGLVPDKERMHVRRPGELMVEGDLLDIDCQPNTTRDKAAWAAHIMSELSDRSIPTTGLLRERQQRLKAVLLNEQRARDLSHMLKESQPKERAMYLVLQAVVCILHLENRVGLKSIESILRSGLSNAQKGILDWTTASGVQHRQDQYVQRISKIIGSKILGTAMAPAQWRFPLSDDGAMGTLSMDNNRTRSVMNSIELLVEESFPNGDINKVRLVRCFPKYRAAMVLLRKSTDLNDDEIETFQGLIDSWFNDWVSVYGKEGCTNYTHMLSSSHVMRYLEEWRCLHRFSQQGWEALNALIKSYFFRRTNRGGLSKNGTKKSKLLGIARWLQRRIMWYSGHGDALFLNDDNVGCEDHNSDSSDDDDDNNTTTSDNDISIYCTEAEDDILKSDEDGNEIDDVSVIGVFRNNYNV